MTTPETPRYDFGLIGLGTMGRALLLNMLDQGNQVVGYNRTPEKAQAIEAETAGRLRVYSDLAAFVQSIRRPRAIMLLVTAGKATDEVLESLVPHLEPDDFLIDGGNAHYRDTDRRIASLTARGFGFMGMGVSGGEDGARYGPSMMPGGTDAQYQRVAPVLESVAAKFDGVPCVARMGNGSAGHYVKMVHNGIEYAIMQAIAEVYDLMHRGMGMTAPECADAFTAWNEGPLGGFLVEITGTVLRRRDDLTEGWLVDAVSDKARAKGTGKWTSQDAMDLGIPVPSIDAAVTARELSEAKPLRTQAESVFGTAERVDLPLAALHDALLASSLIAYAQGLTLIRTASREYGYESNLETIATVWRAGCIIRSVQLEPIRAAFHAQPDLESILLDPAIAESIRATVPALRTSIAQAVAAGIPTPVMSASLAYFDGFRSSRLPANVIQAQRDYFGAHTYERMDREGTFHTAWADPS
jgi:6-phosphogluconate dehydrogenase